MIMSSPTWAEWTRLQEGGGLRMSLGLATMLPTPSRPIFTRRPSRCGRMRGSVWAAGAFELAIRAAEEEKRYKAECQPAWTH